jgi:hypothetical protein
MPVKNEKISKSKPAMFVCVSKLLHANAGDGKFFKTNLFLIFFRNLKSHEMTVSKCLILS